MNMGTIINQMVVLILIMMLGFILGKTGFIDEKGTKTLAKIVLNVFVSANIFSVLLGGSFAITGRSVVIFIFVTAGCFALYYLLGLIFPWLISAPKEDRGVYQCMVMFANCGFMGIPVSEAVFGDEATIYVTCFVVASNIIVYSLGVAIIGKGKESFRIKELISPIIITIVVSIILFAAKVKLPGFILNTADTLSRALTPLSMITIGISLSGVQLRSLGGEWRVFAVTLIKIVITPLIIWLILRNFIKDPMMLGVATVMSGMPIASSVTMLCIEHGANEKLAAKTTFLTTVLTAVTIPLIVYFLL